MLRRSSRPRQFYADFASTSAVDESIEELDLQKYAWHMPQHMGGTRRSKRQQCTDEIKRGTNLAVELLGELPFTKLCTSIQSVLKLERSTTDSPALTETRPTTPTQTTTHTAPAQTEKYVKGMSESG